MLRDPAMHSPLHVIAYINAFVLFHSLSISAPDVMVFLHREYVAFANFLRAWAETDPSLKDAIPTQLAIADRIKAALNEYMWSEELGHYVAYDVKTKKRVR